MARTSSSSSADIPLAEKRSKAPKLPSTGKSQASLMSFTKLSFPASTRGSSTSMRGGFSQGAKRGGPKVITISVFQAESPRECPAAEIDIPISAVKALQNL